jgi:hypothetical protein
MASKDLPFHPFWRDHCFGPEWFIFGQPRRLNAQRKGAAVAGSPCPLVESGAASRAGVLNQ